MNAREFDEMPTTSLMHHIKTGGEIPVLLEQLSLSLQRKQKEKKKEKELQHTSDGAEGIGNQSLYMYI